MKAVLSLIGNPAQPFDLDKAASQAAAQTDVSASHVLAPGIAAELIVETDRPGALVQGVRGALAGLPIDVNLLPAANRRKGLLIADMDSTIITCECLDEIADFSGLKPKVAAITERAMRGELAFEPALRERVALLKGMPDATLEKVYETRVRLTPGARVMVQTMKAHGAFTVLVSGGFTFFTSRVAESAGFDRHRANTLNIKGGRLEGAVAEPILGREAKLAALIETAAARGLPLSDALAVGDGANDLAMIEAAQKAGGLGVAFHAKPLVADAAQARIDHGDLTALLYLQGYGQSDFVT
jgi:phosphoserine phosphatase